MCPQGFWDAGRSASRLQQRRGTRRMGHLPGHAARRDSCRRRQAQRLGNAGICGDPGGDAEWRAGIEIVWLARNPFERRERRGCGDRTIRDERGGFVPMTRTMLLALALAASSGTARADYFVLRSGARMNVDAYQR